MLNLPITHVQLLMIGVPAVMLVAIVEMVRRRRLREDYSLLWLGLFAVLVVLAIFRDVFLDPLAALMGIAYPPAALFVICFGLLLLISLQFSTVLSRLSMQNKQSAQQIALLSARVRELERLIEQNSKP